MLMTTQFALDLRLSRRKAGLTQGDCAHLLEIQQSRFSDFERGLQKPHLSELCKLAIILNRQFDTHIDEEMRQARLALKARLLSLPEQRRMSAPTHNRNHTLQRLKRTLIFKPEQNGDA